MTLIHRHGTDALPSAREAATPGFRCKRYSDLSSVAADEVGATVTRMSRNW